MGKNVVVEAVIRIGHEVTERVRLTRRTTESNAEWSVRLKSECLEAIKSGIHVLVNNSLSVDLVDIPYNTSQIGKGLGVNLMKVDRFGTGCSRIICLVDVVDGTWNTCAGIPFSVSTMLAFTETPTDIPAQEISMDSFSVGLIVPHTGEGFYLGIKEKNPVKINRYGQVKSLHVTKKTNPAEVRCFLDLFTTQTYSSLQKSIRAVIPIIEEWADFGRFYGAGGELMALLGVDNIEPAFGGYVAANQKMDNVISTAIILEGAGVKFTDWKGHSLASHRLMDRVYVAVGANEVLHNRLISVLSAHDTDQW